MVSLYDGKINKNIDTLIILFLRSFASLLELFKIASQKLKTDIDYVLRVLLIMKYYLDLNYYYFEF